ncbi:MAG: hypothetical protein LAO04_11750 [Acidobacteriia bacterium]|nr:hypothetical protein [Terriglobia bacterium]
MAIVMRLMQRLQPSKKVEFMDLEKKFAELEKKAVLPKGQRMTPVAAHEPGNTLIWEGCFTDLRDAQEALRLFETNAEHVALFDQQGPLIEKVWVEFYETLGF